MKNPVWLLASLAWVGCFPVTTGALCDTDANCPDTQACVDRHCAARTGAGGGGGAGGSGGGDTMGGGGGTTTGGGGGTTGGGGGTTGGGGGTTGGGGGTTGGGTGAALPQFLELTSAGGRQAGGTLTLDLQVGHATPRTKMTGGTLELTGAAAVQR